MAMPLNEKVLPDDLTPTLLRSCLSYNPETGAFCWLVRASNGIWPGDEAGTIDGNGYRRISLLHTRYQAHRLAWFYTHGRWPVGILDHIDGAKSNNAINNLREATASQNQRNRPSRGWSYNKRDKRYVASIWIDGKSRHLGNFLTSAEAEAKYLEAHDAVAGSYSFTKRPNGGQTAGASHPSAILSPGAQ